VAKVAKSAEAQARGQHQSREGVKVTLAREAVNIHAVHRISLAGVDGAD
jgi:hypothetical protein